MAHETMICACGHVECLYGVDDAAAKAEVAWRTEAKLPCVKCWRAKLVTATLAEAKKDMRPSLAGTDRQVAWAFRIRDSYVARRWVSDKDIKRYRKAVWWIDAYNKHDEDEIIRYSQSFLRNTETSILAGYLAYIKDPSVHKPKRQTR